MEGNPKDFSPRIGQKKEKGERRKGRGGTERKEESLRNCSVRRSLFIKQVHAQPAGKGNCPRESGSLTFLS